MNTSLVGLLFCHALLLRRSGADGTFTPTTSGNTEKQLSDVVYIGCFSNSCIKLVYHVDVQGDQTTPESCTTSCKDNGYSLAALYNRTKCSCTCEETCNKLLDSSFCGLPCLADQTKSCGSYIAVSLYNVNSNVSNNCSGVITPPTQTHVTSSLNNCLEANTSTKQDSVSFMLEPLNIIYFSFTGAAFVIVIIVVIVRSRRSRGEHADFARTFQRYLQSNRTEGTIHRSTQDMIDYTHPRLPHQGPTPPSSPIQRGDALPITVRDHGSRTNSRRWTSCDADDDLWHDHGHGRGNDNASYGCDPYFSIIPEEGKSKAMKGQVSEGCCSTRASSCSTEGAFAYADCHIGNDDYQRRIVKSKPNKEYK